MPTIQQHFQFAQLMQAAYAFLNPADSRGLQIDALKRGTI